MRTPLVVILIAFASHAAFSQPLPFDLRHQRDLAENPAGLHFRLSSADRPGGFRRGERIPLILEFWSDAPAKYKLDAANYDRSGRLPSEEFVLERNDVADPYSDYFFTGVLGGIAGGLRAIAVLTGKPYRIELDLNDWFRLDQPGAYRLYLKSHRLSRERDRAAEEGESQTVQFAAVSNVLEIVILPGNAQWEAQKLQEIEKLLAQPKPEQPKPGGPPVLVNPLTEQLRSARRDLRFLATPAALDLIFQDARKQETSPDTLAVIGSRDRNRAMAAYDAYLADPSTRINEWDIRVRALLTFVQKESPSPLPVCSWQMKDGWNWQKTREEAERRQKRFEEVVRAEALRLIPAVAAKQEAARVHSGKAIAAIAPAEAQAARLVPPDDYGLSREQLIARFPSLPEDQQQEILAGKKWDLVRGPAMIGALRAVINRAKPEALPKDAMWLPVWGLSNGVGEAALRRLQELAPREAFRIVAADLAAGNLRFARFATLQLQPQDLPEADPVFSRLLAEGEIGALPLIARFATAKLAGDLQVLYLSRSWPCAEEAAFVTYFVRVLPQAGAGSAAEFLEHALANRKDRGCHHFLLGLVAQAVWKPALENAAILALNDPDAETAASAAHALGSFGGPSVEPHLWARLEKWSGKWRGEAAELAVHPITGTVPNPESRLGPMLFQAIANAKSWFFDEARRSRLLALCIDSECRKQWAGGRPTAARWKIDVSNGGSLYPVAFRVGGYGASTFEGLKQKLAQYPKGTAFRWCPQAFNPAHAFSPGQREEMFRDLVQFLNSRSITLEPYEEAKCLAEGLQ